MSDSDDEPTAITIREDARVVVHDVRSFHDVSDRLADAQMEIARLTHAVPAEQATLQAKEGTKQTLLGITGALLVAAGACAFLSGGLLAAVLIAVAGVVGIPEAIRRWREKKKSD